MSNEINIEKVLLPEKLFFQNEMILDLAGLSVLFGLFRTVRDEEKTKFSWEAKSFNNNEEDYIKDLTEALVKTHGDKEFYIELGVNTESVCVFHGVDALLLEEEEYGMTKKYLADLPVDPLTKVSVPLAPLLKFAMNVSHDDYLPLDFKGVSIVRLRDYDAQKEIVLSIDEIKKGIS